MNIDRLKLASALLREVAAKTWKVTTERDNPDSDDVDLKGVAQFNLSHWLDESSGPHCGFSACAVGHMCLDKRFNDLGLVMDFDWGAEGSPALLVGEVPIENCDHGWGAVTNFFEIGSETARELFNDDYYEGVPGPTDVANRIDQLIARN